MIRPFYPLQRFCGCQMWRKLYGHSPAYLNLLQHNRRYASDSDILQKETFDNCNKPTEFVMPIPEFDWNYLTDPANFENIQANIDQRKGIGDISKLHRLWQKYKEYIFVSTTQDQADFLDDINSHFTCDDYLQSQEDDLKLLKAELFQAAADIPNITHPKTPIGDENNASLVETVNEKRVFDFTPVDVGKIGRNLDVLRTENVGITTGSKSYYFKGMFAQLQNALVRYSVDYLKTKGFEMVYVPNLVNPAIIEACGFKAYGQRTQVYHLDRNKHGSVCLAGSSEMPLAALHMDSILSAEELPKKYMAVSRCYRAEVSDLEREKGIYRVHNFTKVEMFGFTTADSSEMSEKLLEEFVNIERYLFTQLGLHFRILEMPSQELGAPAYRKFDMEAWMPAKKFWGEISSASNCLDYQSRRLGIKYWGNSEESPSFVNTVNGTACAVPRLIMAIAETYQTKNGDIEIPKVLHPYMNETTVISKKNKLKMQPIVLNKEYMNTIKRV